MAYLGNSPADRFVAPKAATQFSGDGSTTAFTLDHAVGSDEDILVSVDGVVQEPSVAYAVSNGTTLTFTAAPSSNSGNNIFVYYLFRTVGTVSHPSNNALSATNATLTGNATISGTLGVTGATTLSTKLATSNLGAGAILQAVTATDSTERQTTSNSFVTASNTLAVNITPSSTSNKVFVTCSMSYITPSNTYSFYPTLYRDSTNLGHSTNGFGNLFSGSSYNYSHATLNILDSPNTTSQVTYQPYIKVQANASAGGINNGSGGSFSTITAFEVAG